MVRCCRYRAGSITEAEKGVCESALKPKLCQEGLSGKADMAPNRTREIRLSGMRGRLRGNVDYERIRIPPHGSKECVSVNFRSKVKRAAILSDPVRYEPFCREGVTF